MGKKSCAKMICVMAVFLMTGMTRVREMMAASAPSKQEKVRLALPDIGVAQLYYLLARAKGFYREEEIDLNVERMTSSIATTALTTGDIDYTSLVGITLRSAARGLPVKLVANFSNALFFLIARPGIQSAQDLRGKSVAVTFAAGAEAYLVGKWLARYGLDRKEVVFVSITGGSDRLTALLNGAVDATTFTPPFNAMARQKGLKELSFLGDMMGDLPAEGLSTSDKKITSNPGQVKRVLRATLRAVQSIRENREDTINFIAKEFQLEKEIASGSYDTLMRGLTRDGSITDKGIQNHFEIDRQGGSFTGEVPPLFKLVETQLLTEVQKELGITR